MVRIFNKGESVQITKSFNSSEFSCKCKYSDCKHTLIDVKHVEKLQELRNISGVLWITSAYRCHKHNMAVGGAPGSIHLEGKATDIVPRDISLAVLLDNIDALEFKGVGIYPSFVHIDGRTGNTARWNKV